MCGKLTQRDSINSGSQSREPWYLSATPLATRPWMIRLRRTTASLEAAILLIALVVSPAYFPLGHLAWPIALAALANAAVAWWLSSDGTVPPALALIALGVDVLLLTGLLEMTGGPFNPFILVYAVHVSLAVVTLGVASGVAVGAWATACFGVLIFWHAHEPVLGHHSLDDFPTHLFTMWVALASLTQLVAHFVGQASTALARHEHDLEAMRVRAARSERLVSLSTLAAGAAHELSTPLGTIALAARELEHAAAQAVPSSLLIDDARLIRGEVDRCRSILDQMSGRAGGMAADDPEPVDVAAVVAELAARLPIDRANRLRIEVPDAPASIVVQRAGEPFFTTKDPGRGLGLGLFLARVFAERQGGMLDVSSADGTVVTLELPVPSLSPENP